jgi:phosphatidate phosphatase
MTPIHYLKIFFDIFTLAALLAFFCVIKYVATPFNSYFLCNDYSVNMPMKSSTVTNVYLILISLVFPLVLITTTTLMRLVDRKLKPEKHTRPSFNYKLKLLDNKRVLNVPGYLGDLYIYLGAFLFGCFATADITDFAKVVVGRLRPNFLDVCKPNVNPYTDLCVNSNRTYLVPDVDFVCTAPAELVNESRLSFPSGHSSLSFYSMVYLILFVKHAWSARRLGLFVCLVQFFLFALACMTALSRLADNKHHPTDVLAGSLLGASIGVLTFFQLTSFLRGSFDSSRYNSFKLASTNEDSLADMNNNNLLPIGSAGHYVDGGAASNNVNNRVIVYASVNEVDNLAYRNQRPVVNQSAQQETVKVKRQSTPQNY